ncbi:phosphatidylglycerophosphate synthase [Parvularcula bermudensis HTCC2503]|uniref:CDP-diacylglycerol--glycerol-3-phosphate 3-phosphatidyltransferase n=2 Tax=Parvularcula TaxID=208215 RepID=E0TDT7_PARBH|nr:phosphatidylglycerophosphate synthase [Parvularcula bermudensis HTCC2503]
MGRIAMAIGLAPVLLLAPPWYGVFILLMIAATDVLDGHLARRRGEVTALGAALDPIADKLVAIAALSAYIADGRIEGIHLIPALAILFREALVAGLREAAAGKVALPVSRAAKLKTALQFVAFSILAVPQAASVGLALLWVAGGLTLITGGSYLRLFVQKL